jgi:glycosyltransferase involved in cell wall biosynthesis
MSPLPSPPPNSSLCLLIPARNEAGNLPAFFAQLPAVLAALPSLALEIIFVEGHSTDNTWAVIQNYLSTPPASVTLRAFKQTGRGKADAVRFGLQHAQHDLILIFDADLSVDPTAIPEFYQAYVIGRGTFILGNRLQLRPEPGAMRFFNYLGNYAFAYLFRLLLGFKVHDTLCGAKLFARADYLRWQPWLKSHLGTIDPFGDFELLLAAAHFRARFFELPVRYRARRYGRTNIRRWRDGLKLLHLFYLGFKYRQ